MAVLIEGISVVTRVAALEKSLLGGLFGFKQIVPNQTFCSDGELARVGFMSPPDVETFIKGLQVWGLVFLRAGEAVDIAVVDQAHGPMSECPWLEFGHLAVEDGGHRVASCRLIGSKQSELFKPIDWQFSSSLSARSTFVPTEELKDRVQFLRRDGTLDVYNCLITGREMIVGRADRASCATTPRVDSAVDEARK
jgi:hypothetical protein